MGIGRANHLENTISLDFPSLYPRLVLPHRLCHRTDLIDRNFHALWLEGIRCEILGVASDLAEDADLEWLEQLNERLRDLSFSTDLVLPSNKSRFSRWLYY
jgi:hypothetical protein